MKLKTYSKTALWVLVSFSLSLMAAACDTKDTLSGRDGGVTGGAGVSDPLEVATDRGSIRGSISSEGVVAFKGIPFAAPPVGANRWKAPQPVDPWTETRDATSFGPECPQMSLITRAYSPKSNEDCLYLNLWTPDPPSPKPLPVMVWLHPGAFFFGSGIGDSDQYAGDHLVRKGVIVVTLNYRLSALGFLAHKALSAEDPSHSSGNYGLMDQIQALKWVQKNVAAFGGDKNNVTIFGESAGGRSVILLLTSPAGKGLFHKAIAESGLGMTTTATLAEAEEQGDLFAKAKGCKEAADVLTCLRALPPEQLAGGPGDLTPGIALPKGGINYFDKGINFFPQAISDGVVVPDTPDKVYNNKTLVSTVPVLHGAMTSEGALFHGGLFGESPVVDETEYETVLAKRFDRVSEIVTKYPIADYPTPNDALTAVTGDAFFVCGTRRMARYLTAMGITNYVYTFNLTLDKTLLPVLKDKAFHSADIAYVFGNNSILGVLSEENRPASDTIMSYWTRFASNGDPNGGDSPIWPPYDETADPYLNIDKPIEAITGLKKDKCDFWDTVKMSW